MAIKLPDENIQVVYDKNVAYVPLKCYSELQVEIKQLRAQLDRALEVFITGCPPNRSFDYGRCPKAEGGCEKCCKKYVVEGE
jgi:hypothetical protein